MWFWREIVSKTQQQQRLPVSTNIDGKNIPRRLGRATKHWCPSHTCSSPHGCLRAYMSYAHAYVQQRCGSAAMEVQGVPKGIGTLNSLIDLHVISMSNAATRRRTWFIARLVSVGRPLLTSQLELVPEVNEVADGYRALLTCTLFWHNPPWSLTQLCQSCGSQTSCFVRRLQSTLKCRVLPTLYGQRLCRWVRDVLLTWDGVGVIQIIFCQTSFQH